MTVLDKILSRFFFKNTYNALFLSIAALFISCEESGTYNDISGPAMGTTYTVRLVPKRGLNANANLIKTKIDSTLESINDQMSTYVINSDISLFNKILPSVIHFLSWVLENSLKIIEETLSNRMFDNSSGTFFTFCI